MKSQIKSLIAEVNTLKLQNATFEERFQRLLDKAEQTDKRIDQLTSWSFGWRTSLLILLSTIIIQALLLPLEKYFHFFGL